MTWKWKINSRYYLPYCPFNSKWKTKVIVFDDGDTVAADELLPKYKSILQDMLFYLSMSFKFEIRQSLVILQDIRSRLFGEEKFIVSLIDDDYEDEKDYRTLFSISYRIILDSPFDNVIGVNVPEKNTFSSNFPAWVVAINTFEISRDAYEFLADISSWIGFFIKTKGYLDDKKLFAQMCNKALKILDNYRLDSLDQYNNLYIDINENLLQLWETGDKEFYFKYQSDPKFGYWADIYEDKA